MRKDILVWRFKIILLLEKDKVEIREELLERTKNQCETKIRQGEMSTGKHWYDLKINIDRVVIYGYTKFIS